VTLTLTFWLRRKHITIYLVDRRYYKKQDELISAYEGIQLDNSKLNSETTRIQLRKQATRLAKVSFFMNFVSFYFFQCITACLLCICTSLYYLYLCVCVCVCVCVFVYSHTAVLFKLTHSILATGNLLVAWGNDRQDREVIIMNIMCHSAPSVRSLVVAQIWHHCVCLDLFLSCGVKLSLPVIGAGVII